MANEQGRQAAQASRLPSSCTYDGVGDGVVVAAEAMLGVGAARDSPPSAAAVA